VEKQSENSPGLVPQFFTPVRKIIDIPGQGRTQGGEGFGVNPPP